MKKKPETTLSILKKIAKDIPAIRSGIDLLVSSDTLVKSINETPSNVITITERPDLKTSDLLNLCRAKFQVWSWYNDKKLDEEFPAPKTATTRYFLNEQEPDKETLYLKPRTESFTISPTKGKWDKSEQKKKFSWIDFDFENYGSVSDSDNATERVSCLAYDLVQNGSYSQIIPDTPENFFQNATQALQVIHDSPELVKEVLENDKRVHLPFKNSAGDKFVANVFENDGALSVRVLEFSYDLVWNAEHGNVFVFPQLNLENLNSFDTVSLRPFVPHAPQVKKVYCYCSDCQNFYKEWVANKK